MQNQLIAWLIQRLLEKLEPAELAKLLVEAFQKFDAAVILPLVLKTDTKIDDAVEAKFKVFVQFLADRLK